VVMFASFGNPIAGASQHVYTKGDCNAGSSKHVVERDCLFKNTCQVLVSSSTFGQPCASIPKKLAVSALCGDKRIA